MNVTLLTPTVFRPEAFELCERYIARQTVQPFQWLVLDDDERKTTCTQGQEYFHWPEYRGRGSLALKIKRALTDGLIKGDAIIVVENDDYYSPDYIEWCLAGLKDAAIFGEGRALYYNVQQRFWFEHTNMEHASLCATSMRREVMPWLLKQCTVSQEPFLDVRLWNRAPVPTKVHDPYRDPSRRRRSVGIKAMPGITGYGGGHRGRDRSAVDDLALIKLRSLIGDDAANYEPFYDPKKRQLPAERNGHIAPKVHQTPMTAAHVVHSETGRVHGPNWSQWLQGIRCKPGIVGAEIGTFEGSSAEWMLDNVFTDPTSRYHCIDPFTGSIEHKVASIDTTRLEESTRKRLSRFKNVEIHKAYSQDFLRTFETKLDLVYVDGAHDTRSVMRDAVLAFDLLKVGGVMIFDDLSWGVFPNELDRPKLGIEMFIKCYAKHLSVLNLKGMQAAIIKRNDD